MSRRRHQKLAVTLWQLQYNGLTPLGSQLDAEC
jgi:hypothetical protein